MPAGRKMISAPFRAIPSVWFSRHGTVGSGDNIDPMLPGHLFQWTDRGIAQRRFPGAWIGLRQANELCSECGSLCYIITGHLNILLLLIRLLKCFRLNRSYFYFHRHCLLESCFCSVFLFVTFAA